MEQQIKPYRQKRERREDACAYLFTMRSVNSLAKRNTYLENYDRDKPQTTLVFLLIVLVVLVLVVVVVVVVGSRLDTLCSPNVEVAVSGLYVAARPFGHGVICTLSHHIDSREFRVSGLNRFILVFEAKR